MSHVRITIACACAMLLASSSFAFGYNKGINAKNETVETEIVIEASTCECENIIESYSEEEKENETIENKIIKLEENKDKEELEETLETTELENIEEVETIVLAAEIKEPYITKYVPSNNSFKSYMSYKAITSKSSPQYKLQQQAYTGEYGIRMVNGRYCIALGSYYTTTIGTKLDVVMANGSVLKCILADAKSNKHTDAANIKARDGSVVEFLIDKNSLHPMARKMGNISYAADKFAGEIKEIRVYQ